MNRLQDKVAIVTGGGTGIGRGIALAISAEGGKVVVCGRRELPLSRVVEIIQASGGQALAITADVSQEAAAARLVERTQQAFGRIDILVNNAGIAGGDYIHRHDTRDWDAVMAVNLRGPFLVSRAVLPIFRAQ